MSTYVDVTEFRDRFRKKLVVANNSSVDDITSAIKLPEYLTSPDGRVLRLTGWHPHVVTKNVVKVTIEALVEIPDERPADGKLQT